LDLLLKYFPKNTEIGTNTSLTNIYSLKACLLLDAAVEIVAKLDTNRTNALKNKRDHPTETLTEGIQD
jgi:hypothetical protein